MSWKGVLVVLHLSMTMPFHEDPSLSMTMPFQARLFYFFWPQDRSETLRSGPGMLLDPVSDQTVNSVPDSDHF